MASPKSYKETIAWLYKQLPMYQNKGPEAYSHKLDPIRDFLAYLGNPEKSFKSIHVAGTNGKGSSCHMLASILAEAGYKTGLYTSPHLLTFRERILVNGHRVSKEYVQDFIHSNEEYIRYHPLSFFELTVAMAFKYFADSGIDWGVIETGLGGRLDSTNVIQPRICLITHIGWDHMNILGDTLPKIAMEKAGIIKPETPVVISERQPGIDRIFELYAARMRSPIMFASDDPHSYYETDLLGNYQHKNQAGVRAVLEWMPELKLKEKDIRDGLQLVVHNTGLRGRWEVLGSHPMVVCDTAHNQDGWKAIKDQMFDMYYKKLHVVLGVVKDKDLERVAPFWPQDATYYFVEPSVERAMPVLELQRKAKALGYHGKRFMSVGEAYEAAMEAAAPEDFVLISGSTFVVADLLRFLKKKEKQEEEDVTDL